MFVSASLLVTGLAFISLQAFGSFVATLAAALTGVLMVVGLSRLPLDSLVWSKGIEGERRAADYLAPVIAADYIVLYNRLNSWTKW